MSVRGLLTLLTAIVAFALGGAPNALASHSQTTTLQDDQLLIYSPRRRWPPRCRRSRAWGSTASACRWCGRWWRPSPTRPRSPRFNAANPNAYPGGAWARYDLLDVLAARDGLQVYFQPTAPAPTWATPPRQLDQGYRWSHDPNAADFGQFVQAVGKRYNGSSTTTAVDGTPDAAAGRPRLGHLERAEHRRLDDAAVDQGARPVRARPPPPSIAGCSMPRGTAWRGPATATTRS